MSWRFRAQDAPPPFPSFYSEPLLTAPTWCLPSTLPIPSATTLTWVSNSLNIALTRILFQLQRPHSTTCSQTTLRVILQRTSTTTFTTMRNLQHILTWVRLLYRRYPVRVYISWQSSKISLFPYQSVHITFLSTPLHNLLNVWTNQVTWPRILACESSSQLERHADVSLQRPLSWPMEYFVPPAAEFMSNSFGLQLSIPDSSMPECKSFLCLYADC